MRVKRSGQKAKKKFRQVISSIRCWRKIEQDEDGQVSTELSDSEAIGDLGKKNFCEVDDNQIAGDWDGGRIV